MTNRWLALSAFNYTLPEDRIAHFPLSQRDQSKLLVYKNETITEDCFSNLSTHIPENALLVFNDSKVIPARIVFRKSTGAKIEVFCLECLEESTQASVWKCFVGGAAKWKEETLMLQQGELVLSARMYQRTEDAYEIHFQWNNEHKLFYDVLDAFGDIPLPPYIKRETVESDKDTYQTVYSSAKGSVAAPTAGLHFTESVFKTLQEKCINRAFVTLHVGAGTFKPIKTANVYDHTMHTEWIDVSKAFVERIKSGEDVFIIPVGTTSLRTLETLYWLGVKVMIDGVDNAKNLELKQWENEKYSAINVSVKDAFQVLYDYLEVNNLDRLIARTQIMITPDYTIKTAKAIVTNFHQPESSLLLLISAFVGNDWHTIYDYALSHDFRFLSYGDSSLLFLD
ncbi:MAG: S-adenosylmethionine:tRNA ribosyltransferase-isomerase [Chitinophagales bacterium]